MKTVGEHRPPKEISALRAISYVLKRRHQDPIVAYKLGFGSEAFERLIDAQAQLTGESREDVLNEEVQAKTVNPDAWRLALERIIWESNSQCAPGCDEYHPCAHCIAQEALTAP